MAHTEDVVAIREVIDRYALGIDRRDWAMVASCFTDDCTADYGRSGRWTERYTFMSALAEMHAAVGPTLHRMSNHMIEVDGQGATAVSYLDALLKVEHRSFDLLHVAAVYADALIMRVGEWKITERRVEPFLWRREHASTPDP